MVHQAIAYVRILASVCIMLRKLGAIGRADAVELSLVASGGLRPNGERPMPGRLSASAPRLSDRKW
jgi:hypothetical protein